MAEILIALLVFLVTEYDYRPSPRVVSWAQAYCSQDVYHAEHPCLVVKEW